MIAECSSAPACAPYLHPLYLSNSRNSSGLLHHRCPARSSASYGRRLVRVQAAAAGVAVPSPAAQPVPQVVTEVLAPPQIYQKCLEIGVGKANSSAAKIFLMAILGGCFVSIGGFLALTVGMNCPGIASSNPGLQKMIFGAFGFPISVMLVVMTGSELFTGNTFFLPLAMLEKKATVQQLAKSWFFSYLGNVVGCLLLVAAAAQTGLLAEAAGPVKLSVGKTSLTTAQVVVRSIIANWLVCMAFWLANGAQSLISKMVGIWFPISAFAAMGLEHSVANMFIVPMGIALGAPVSISSFIWNNLLPVSIGNVIAGACCVALPFAFAYGSLGSKKA